MLAMLLATHQRVCTMGEMKATHLADVSRYRCSCGELITQCPFWAGVSGAMLDRGIDFDVAHARTAFLDGRDGYVGRLLRPLHRGPMMERLRDAALLLSPVWQDRMRIIQWRNAMLAEVLCDLTGARVVVDSSKIGLRLKYLLGNPGLNVKVIRLIRDGRCVALAYMHPEAFADAADPACRGGGAGGGRDDERQTISNAARQWRRSNEEARKLLSRLDRSRWIEVRYEALCADPASMRRRIFEFLRLDPDQAAPVDQFRQAAAHVIGNGMRLDEGATIEADQRWRSEFAAADLQVFDAMAGQLNRRYGYE